MKTITFVILFVFLLVAPFLAIRPIKNYYNEYEEIARKYECYPIEKCNSDYNDDGKVDIYEIKNEPTEIELRNLRLKIFVEQDNQKKEILNIKYDSTDNTFRTHIAIFEENGKRKLVIYDTINNQQFFVWDGSQLVPAQERTLLEREIWKAMSLEDDTGGFNQKLNLDLTLIPLFSLYYILFLLSVGMYIYFRRKLKSNLA